MNNQASLPFVDPFKPFRSQGTVSVNLDSEESPLQIMGNLYYYYYYYYGNTASAKSIILKSVIPRAKREYTGEKAYLKDFQKTFTVPLAKMHPECQLVKGTVTVALSEDSPCPFLSIISC